MNGQLMRREPDIIEVVPERVVTRRGFKEIIEIKPRYIIIGLSLISAVVAFRFTPSVIDKTKDLISEVGRIDWSKLKIREIAILLFLLSGQVVPYFTIAFVWYLYNLPKKSQ